MSAHNPRQLSAVSQFSGLRLVLVGDHPQFKSAKSFRHVGKPKAHSKHTPRTKSKTHHAKKIKPEAKSSSVVKRVVNTFLTGVISVAVVVCLVVVIPLIYYSFLGVETVPIKVTSSGTPLGGDFTTTQRVVTYQPPVDTTLPQGQWLIIPRIEVRTQLHETKDPAEGLSKGVWMVPQYGEPGDTEQPMILAAHRYGYKIWWENDYWKYHSFYNLPQLEPGDMVEVIANQQKWIYEIYAGEEGEEITDYNADLILYTCKFLNSPVRHFKYARLIDPTRNTQVGYSILPSK